MVSTRRTASTPSLFYRLAPVRPIGNSAAASPDGPASIVRDL